MKQEAEANAEADKQEKDRIDKLNQADSMIFQTEKQLKEFGDKIPDAKRKPITEALEKLKEAHKNQDLSAIDSTMAELNTAFQAASQDMYNAQNAQQAQDNDGAQGQPQSDQKEEVTDVDFEEVK